jgi:hypothetical protein
MVKRVIACSINSFELKMGELTKDVVYYSLLINLVVKLS